MPYSNQTDNYKIPYMQDGDISSGAEEAKLANALDRTLHNLIYYRMGDGVIEGWTLDGVGEEKQVSAGKGMVAGCFVRSDADSDVTGITNGVTNYIMARKNSTSPWDMTVSFVAQTSPTPPSDGIIIGSWDIDADGNIAAVDPEPQGYRWLSGRYSPVCAHLLIEDVWGDGEIYVNLGFKPMAAIVSPSRIYQESGSGYDGYDYDPGVSDPRIYIDTADPNWRDATGFTVQYRNIPGVLEFMYFAH